MYIFSYDLHLVHFILGVFTIIMVVFNGIIEHFEQSLPQFIVEAFRYGKTLNGPVQTKLVRLIQVPKSWFLHFYIFSSIYSPFILYQAYSSYMRNTEVPATYLTALDVVCTENRSPSASKENILLALTLLCIQCFRRFYECAFVNAKSTSSMNILHYIVGYAHYFCTATGILCQAPGYSYSSDSEEKVNLIELINMKTFLCVAIFTWAWIHQFRAHKIFAGLKSKNANKHGIPEGDLFELVSCPHYFCEVLIYTSLALLLGYAHTTMLVVWVWVAVNQTVAAFMSHTWYNKQFKEYPKTRKAIFPFIL